MSRPDDTDEPDTPARGRNGSTTGRSWPEPPGATQPPPPMKGISIRRGVMVGVSVAIPAVALEVTILYVDAPWLRSLAGMPPGPIASIALTVGVAGGCTGRGLPEWLN